jgi:hypothetical protein
MALPSVCLVVQYCPRIDGLRSQVVHSAGIVFARCTTIARENSVTVSWSRLGRAREQTRPSDSKIVT